MLLIVNLNTKHNFYKHSSRFVAYAAQPTVSKLVPDYLKRPQLGLQRLID